MRASITYQCKTSKGRPFSITAELIETNANDYGNKHYIVIEEESGYEYNLDARYDVRFNTVEKFYKNIIDVLRDRYDIATYKQIRKA